MHVLEDSRGPLFVGIRKLLETISGLYKRPSFIQKCPDQEIRGDQPLPLVYLQGETGSDGFFEALSSRLEDPAVQVVHAVVDMDEIQERVNKRWASDAGLTREPPLVPVLDELVFHLSADAFGRRRLPEFNRYRLTDMLTGQELPAPFNRHDRAAVAVLIRSWAGKGTRPDQSDLSKSLPDFVSNVSTKFAIKVLVLVARHLWLTRIVENRVPEARWFMRRQPYTVPRHSTTFLGFAERLTVGRRASANEEQIKKLLVHAFLEDLRVAYRRRRWFLPRPKGWNRTSYVVVMLKNVGEENGGWELLRLLNAVRNETGELDPLLVIATGELQPPQMNPATNPPLRPDQAQAALSAWRRSLPSRRQRLANDARYLPILLPAPAGQDEHLPEEERTAWDSAALFRPRSSPVLSRTGILAAVTAALLVSVALPLALGINQSLHANCSLSARLWQNDEARVLPMVIPTGETGTRPDHMQCVGYSGTEAQVFGTDDRLKLAQLNIFRENAIARNIHANKPERAYFSLVYFAGLTHYGFDTNTDHAIAEELEGIYLQQHSQNTRSETNPLLNIIIANGGSEMQAAQMVTRDMLVPLAEKHSEILGVIGLDRTTMDTKLSIRALGLHGIPTMGTALTGTGLDRVSPMYFGMVPDNARQVTLIALFAKSLNAKKIYLYYPPRDKNEIYVQTLVDQMEKLKQKPLKRPWTNGINALYSPCSRPRVGLSEVDHRDELVVYAGRENNIGDWMTHMFSGCRDPDLLPRIVANDTTSRFIAQAENRKKGNYPVQKVYYVGMGSSVDLKGPECFRPQAPSGSAVNNSPISRFCSMYRDLRATMPPAMQADITWPGERVGLAYDATGVFINAVNDLYAASQKDATPALPNRGSVALHFRETTFIYPGATGDISFHDFRTGENRSLAILEIADINDVNAFPRCAYLISGLSPADGRQNSTNICPKSESKKPDVPPATAPTPLR